MTIAQTDEAKDEEILKAKDAARAKEKERERARATETENEIAAKKKKKEKERDPFAAPKDEEHTRF